MRIGAVGAGALLAGLVASGGTGLAQAQDNGSATALSPLWAGAYAGVHMGFGRAEGSAIDFGAPVGDGAFACASALTPYCGSPFDYDATGAVSGVQLGYNWLRGALLFGIEGDLGRIDVNGETIRDRGVDRDLASIDYGWHGTLTARVGMPADRALFYLKGGAALAEVKTKLADVDEAFSTGTGFWHLAPNATVEEQGVDVGWALGGGIEYALGASWSVKAEYLYMDFGSGVLVDADGDRYKFENQLHTVMLGLNYHPSAAEPGTPSRYDDLAGGSLWDGRYLGVHAAWAQTRTQSVDHGTPLGEGAFACVPGGSCGQPFEFDGDGWVSGVQLGRNWQRGGFVFGLEGDLGRIDLQKDALLIRPLTDRDQATVDYGWYGAATARLGLPFERALIYVKGGVALAHITNTAADLDQVVVPGGPAYYVHPLSPTRASRLDAGWTLGGGVEYALNPAWRLKAEYLYMDFGSEVSADPDGDLYEHDNALHIVKLGLNYAFGQANAPLPAE